MAHAMALDVVSPVEQTRPALLDLTPDQWKALLAERRQPPMRAKQLRRWMLQARATGFDEMSDLPKALREELAR